MAMPTSALAGCSKGRPHLPRLHNRADDLHLLHHLGLFRLYLVLAEDVWPQLFTGLRALSFFSHNGRYFFAQTPANWYAIWFSAHASAPACIAGDAAARTWPTVHAVALLSPTESHTTPSKSRASTKGVWPALSDCRVRIGRVKWQGRRQELKQRACAGLSSHPLTSLPDCSGRSAGQRVTLRLARRC